MVWELFFKLTEKRPVDNPVGCSDTTGLHRIKQTVPLGKVLPFRKVLPDKLNSCFLIWKNATGTRTLLLVSDPHDLLFPRLRTVLILFLCSWVANTASGASVGLITKADRCRRKDHSFPGKKGSLGEDFIGGAGFNLSCLYTYQRIYHDSTLRDDSCPFASGSGADGGENCKALSGKLERGTRWSPGCRCSGGHRRHGPASQSCWSPARFSSACTSAPTQKSLVHPLHTRLKNKMRLWPWKSRLERFIQLT